MLKLSKLAKGDRDAMTAPFVGQRFIRNGATLEVTSVTPILTPYRRAGQTTKIEGWSLGVREVPAFHPLNLIDSPAQQNIPVRTELGNKVRAAFAEALQERGSFMSSLDFNAIERRVCAAMEEAFAKRTAALKKDTPKDTVIFALYGNPPPGTPLHACASFHAHLDQCAQCREHPMELCPIGATLLTLEKP